jgi:hypothetical protein
MDAKASNHLSVGLELAAGTFWSLFSDFTVLVKKAPTGGTAVWMSAASQWRKAIQGMVRANPVNFNSSAFNHELA